MKIRASLSLLVILLLIACRKDDAINELTNEVSFNVNSIVNSAGRVAGFNLEEAAFLLVTIKNVDGSSTDYSLEKIDLYQIEGEYISEKIPLPVGDYDLTEFFVLDSENNITHIAPVEGSEQAQNVSDPLPIQFSVLTDQITSVSVEVISSENLSLEDFGLAGFNLSEIKLFHFLVTVSVRGDFEHLLDGTITIASGDYQFTKQILAKANNSVVIKDGYSSYQLTIQKDGYDYFDYTYSRDSLRHYESVPLSIELVNSDSDGWRPGDDWVDERDGQSYSTVQIGDQVWMAENLKATLYNDGAPIEFPGTDIQAWENNTTGAYALYNNDETLYGMLYNWYAVNTNKLCPVGWHIPSDDEWLTLSTFLGGSSVAGGKMKVTGTDSWESPNIEASNSSAFSAYPAGWAYFINGHYSHRGNRAAFWSSDEGIDGDHGTSRQIEHDSSELKRYISSNSSNKGNGFSCRCVKD